MPSPGMPINLETLLDGIPFPTEKVHIIAYADEQGASEEALELLRALPEKNFHDMKDLNAELGLVGEQPGDANLWSSNEDKSP